MGYGRASRVYRGREPRSGPSRKAWGFNHLVIVVCQLADSIDIEP